MYHIIYKHSLCYIYLPHSYVHIHTILRHLALLWLSVPIMCVFLLQICYLSKYLKILGHRHTHIHTHNTPHTHTTHTHTHTHSLTHTIYKHAHTCTPTRTLTHTQNFVMTSVYFAPEEGPLCQPTPNNRYFCLVTLQQQFAMPLISKYILPLTFPLLVRTGRCCYRRNSNTCGGSQLLRHLLLPPDLCGSTQWRGSLALCPINRRQTADSPHCKSRWHARAPCCCYCCWLLCWPPQRSRRATPPSTTTWTWRESSATAAF